VLDHDLALIRGYKKPSVQHSTMEEQELDEWFTEQREKLEARFYAVLNENKESTKEKERFEKDYQELILEFQKRQMALYAQQKRLAALQAPMARWSSQHALLQTQLENWWAGRKAAYKKWRFDRKIRRILKDKRDLY